MSSADRYYKRLKEKYYPEEELSKTRATASSPEPAANPAGPVLLGPVQPGHFRLEYDCPKCNAQYALDLADEMRDHIRDYFGQTKAGLYEMHPSHRAVSPSGDIVEHVMKVSINKDLKVVGSRWTLTKRES